MKHFEDIRDVIKHLENIKSDPSIIIEDFTWGNHILRWRSGFIQTKQRREENFSYPLTFDEFMSIYGSIVDLVSKKLTIDKS